MKQIVRIVCLIAGIVSLAVIACADHSHDYQRASDAYNAGDFKTAFHLWREEAEKGDVEAKEMVGAMYAAGEGVSQDYEESAKWYRMAAEEGHVSAQYVLGNYYSQGRGVAKSKEEAYAWWLVAAANGSKTAKEKFHAISKEMSDEELQRAHLLVVNIMKVLAE
jgi:TPR repeat protein